MTIELSRVAETASDAASVPPRPASAAACPDVRIAVCYDGCWYQNAARFFVRMRGAEISVAGLHAAFRWHAAGVFGCPVQRVTVTQAHYVAGRGCDAPPTGWDQKLADHGVVRHDVPVTVGKGEVGADVEFALTCYQIACEGNQDMIVLVAGDGDFAPLAARLAGRGLRVLVPRANFSYPIGPTTITVTTSALLTRRATDTPALTDLLDAAMGPDYPPFLSRPLTPSASAAIAAPAEPATRHQGTVSRWSPEARYGFITSGRLTWYASTKETPGHAILTPGTQVTFTGQPTPPPGKLYPRACAIIPQSSANVPQAQGNPPANLKSDDGGTGTEVGTGTEDETDRHWLTVVDSGALTRSREKLGWTRGELARQSGVSVTTINRLERADLNCHIRTVSRVAAALGQPTSALTRSATASR